MRKLFFITAILAFTFVSAQKNVIKADPVGLVFGMANASYEAAIAEKQSISVSGLYYHYPDSGDRIDLKGFGLGVIYNFYLSKEKEVLKGFHAGPGLGYSFLNYSKDILSGETGVSSLKYKTFSLNANVGYQWIIGNHFAVDVTGQYYYLTNPDIIGTKRSNYTFGVSLGYAW